MIIINHLNSKPVFLKLYPKVLFIMPQANCVFPQRDVARHHAGFGIFKLSIPKADVTWKKEIFQIIEKYSVVNNNLRERLERENAYICEQHYKEDDIEFTSKLQNKFLYFCHAYGFG